MKRALLAVLIFLGAAGLLRKIVSLCGSGFCDVGGTSFSLFIASRNKKMEKHCGTFALFTYVAFNWRQVCTNTGVVLETASLRSVTGTRSHKNVTLPVRRSRDFG